MNVSRYHARMEFAKEVYRHQICPSMMKTDCFILFIFHFFQVISNTVKLSLIIIDKKSKSGTFVNSGIDLNERIESNCVVVLKLNDRIRFGANDSIWT